MPASGELLFGKIALNEGFCSQAQIDECTRLQLQLQSPHQPAPRLGDLLGVDTDLRPGVLGPGAQLTGEVGHKHQLTRLSFGVAGEQLVDQAAGRLGNTRMQQRGWGDDQDGAGLAFAGGRRR